MKIGKVILVALCTALLLAACGGGPGTKQAPGGNSIDLLPIIAAVSWTPGFKDTTCENGEYGYYPTWTNKATGEIVSNDHPICSGKTGATGQPGTKGDPGLTPFLDVSDVTLDGRHCARFDSGYDTNGNGILDSGDTGDQSHVFVCDGDPGIPGKDGTTFKPQATQIACADNSVGYDFKYVNSTTGETIPVGSLCPPALPLSAYRYPALMPFNAGDEPSCPTENGVWLRIMQPYPDGGQSTIVQQAPVCGKIGPKGDTGATSPVLVFNMTTQVIAGVSCDQLDVGYDLNGNKVWDNGETVTSSLRCDGQAGKTGAPGATWIPQKSVIDCGDGLSGFDYTYVNSITGETKSGGSLCPPALPLSASWYPSLASFSPGDELSCPTLSGIWFRIMSTSSIIQQLPMCNTPGQKGDTGATGPAGQMVVFTVFHHVPVGDRDCDRVEVGYDKNGNKKWDSGETDPNGISFVCNGKDGADGTPVPGSDLLHAKNFTNVVLHYLDKGGYTLPLGNPSDMTVTSLTFYITFTHLGPSDIGANTVSVSLISSDTFSETIADPEPNKAKDSTDTYAFTFATPNVPVYVGAAVTFSPAQIVYGNVTLKRVDVTGVYLLSP